MEEDKESKESKEGKEEKKVVYCYKVIEGKLEKVEYENYGVDGRKVSKHKRKGKGDYNRNKGEILKKFASNLIKSGGKKKGAAYAAAVKEVKGRDMSEKVGSVVANKVLNEESSLVVIREYLEREGIGVSFLVKKLKKLAEAKNGDGSDDNGTQFNILKLGLELHGLINKKGDKVGNLNLNQFNYNNMDVGKLGEVIGKLNELNKDFIDLRVEERGERCERYEERGDDKDKVNDDKVDGE